MQSSLSCVALSALVVSCDFSASSKVLRDSVDTAAAVGGAESGAAAGASGVGAGTGDDETGEDETGTAAASRRDEDGDGFSAEEGDCDDGDATVYPGATDLCDGRDEDCDGDIDEDARFEDQYEDNDTHATDLGDLSGGGSVILDALLDSAEDVDRFTVRADDSSFSLWDMTVRLTNIPDGYTWKLKVTEPTGETHETTGAVALTIERSDQAFVDDAGTWEVVIEAVDGAPCDARYLLSIDFSG